MNGSRPEPARSVVGIAEMAVCGRGGRLVTYSLGSCVGVALLEETTGVGGLVHCLLPLSRIDPERARRQPATFADTGLVAAIEGVLAAAAGRGRLTAWIAGGASLLGGLFEVGSQNCEVARRVLAKNGIPILGEDVGGTIARTMIFELDGGTVRVQSPGREVRTF